MIPPVLRRLASAPRHDVLLACPGLTYRRDCIDRLHTGEPHQVDLWRIRQRERLGVGDLEGMIAVIAATLLPGRTWRTLPAQHPYTTDGRQIDVQGEEGWVEIGECGLAHPAVLAEAGLSPHTWSGLAMGLGLDRILMLRKGIDDIRLLRDEDARVARQMRNLSPYHPISRQPPIRRDLSLAVADETDAETIGDRVRDALGEAAQSVESIEVLSQTPGAKLPAAARARIGLQDGQKNVLLRVTLRHPSRTLTALEANRLRDAVYAAIHQGTVHQWAAGDGPSWR